LAIYALPREGLSAGRGKKVAVVVAAVANGGTITTGLTSIDGAMVCHQASTALGGSASAFLAEMRSASGGVITVNVISFTTTPAVAAYTNAANVCAIAFGS
jgi:hypothetical protein